MQTAVEKLTGLKRRLKVTVPADKVNEAYQKKLKNYAKKADLKGFRPGKAPINIVEARFGEGVQQEVAGDLMESSFREAVEELKLEIASQPHVHPGEVKKGQSLEYEATFEVFPEITLKDFSQVSIEKVTAEVTEKDVDKMLEKIREENPEWVDVERPAKKGDKVSIDFEGFIDDEPFKGGKAEAYEVELGSGQMVPGFEEGLMGGKPEESLDLPVNFPEDYPHEDLANKKALFKITVHTIQEPKLLPLDDTLAKKVGVEAGFEGLKTKVRERMELELKHWLESKVKEDVLDKLIALNAISIPNALLDKEIENLQKMAESYINSANQGGVSNTPPRELFTERAEKQVMVGLLFSEIIKTCDMKVDRAKVQEKIVELAAGYQEPEKMVDMMSKNERWRSDAEATVLEEQVISKLMDDANVVVKSVSYNDIMNTEENEDKE